MKNKIAGKLFYYVLMPYFHEWLRARSLVQHRHKINVKHCLKFNEIDQTKEGLSKIKFSRAKAPRSNNLYNLFG
jgi:hypothetical protein